MAFSFASTVKAVAAPNFAFTSATADETVYVYGSGSVPVSCANYPAASDSYDWTVKIDKATSGFTQLLANSIVIVAFNSGTCNPLSDVTNTLEFPPGAAYIHVDASGITNADFTGAIPDFNSYNTNNGADLPFFDGINFHLVYNLTSVTAEGLKPGFGNLEVTGNANLCGAITSAQPQQCLVLDLGYGSVGGGNTLSCVCTTPNVTSVDITDIIE
jgi:hypothetical protein